MLGYHFKPRYDKQQAVAIAPGLDRRNGALYLAIENNLRRDPRHAVVVNPAGHQDDHAQCQLVGGNLLAIDHYLGAIGLKLHAVDKNTAESVDGAGRSQAGSADTTATAGSR